VNGVPQEIYLLQVSAHQLAFTQQIDTYPGIAVMLQPYYIPHDFLFFPTIVHTHVRFAHGFASLVLCRKTKDHHPPGLQAGLR
jgi:hypothetical protein